MTRIVKTIDQLTIADLERYPVWEFNLEYEGELDETAVQPVEALPVRSLDGRIVGTTVTLANGDAHWAILGGIDLKHSDGAKDLDGLSLFRNGERIVFAPMLDFGDAGRQAKSFAEALGLDIDDVFPIAYDISRWCIGDPKIVRGSIHSRAKTGP
ncbi:MAG: hypothetical protein ABSD74_15360 [Rhizomicrobium sp.]